MSAGAINLLGDQGRALQAAASLASRHVAASVNAKRGRCGIEIGLQHKCRERVSYFGSRFDKLDAFCVSVFVYPELHSKAANENEEAQ